jgi:hypothetical protein
VPFLELDPVGDLFAVDGNTLRCLDAYANLVAFDFKQGHGDVRADLHGFGDFAGEYEHSLSVLAAVAVNYKLSERVNFPRNVHALALEFPLGHIGDADGLLKLVRRQAGAVCRGLAVQVDS